MSVPKRIFQAWIGPPEPAHITDLRETVQAHHRGWEYRYITNDNMPKLINQKLYDDAERWHTGNVWQVRADILRYELLVEGGVWVDADFEFRAGLDRFMDCEGFMGWAVQGKVLNNALIGITAHHPLMSQLIRALPISARKYKPRTLATWKAGPRFMTPYARRHDLCFIDEEVFYPYRWNDLDNHRHPSAEFLHHWENQRTLQGKPA